MSDTAKPRLIVGVGAQGIDLLDHWGYVISRAFGETPYHVGSSAMQKTGWRDVDVRIIMDDEKFDALFGKDQGRFNPFWTATMLAYSIWGERVTGLPIDFQIQRRSSVSQDDWDKPRNPLGISGSICQRPEHLPSWHPDHEAASLNERTNPQEKKG